MKRAVSKTLIIKKRRVESEWSIIKNLKKLRELYKPTVTIKELEEELRNTKPYYLNKKGLSVLADRSDVSKSAALYQWGMLKGWETPDGEQLFVWMRKADDGNFKYIHFGTRKDFDFVVAKGDNTIDKEIKQNRINMKRILSQRNLF